jgi:hypothetical protein
MNCTAGVKGDTQQSIDNSRMDLCIETFFKKRWDMERDVDCPLWKFDLSFKQSVVIIPIVE